MYVVNRKWVHNPCLLGVPNKGTESEVATQTVPSWGGGEAPPPPPQKKQQGIFTMNIWGDRFYQPLLLGHQNIRAPLVPANFSILACTMVGAF